ncbi:hypothetical protein [Actinoplanes sp. RD1]|uniref:hypothetical protein n=1 Tax=Actinoplanes sp. RD1 TaxID=3064538 RepID=UPI00274044F0|nr:hypothetical protein [Actinoplanes sp. RD1]
MRKALFLAVLTGALLVPAGPASAHGGEAPDATAYRIEVTGLTEQVPGLTVRVVEAGARLELVNETGHSVEVLGYQGEPYLDVRPDGVWQNVNSPATYTNATLDGDAAVPATADPTAAPQWRKISAETTVRWHDQRDRWLSDGLPPQAQADPSRPHELRKWAVPLRSGARTYAVEGTLTWEPPPRAWLWWAGAVALAAGIVLARRWVGPVALVAGLTTLAYAITRAAVGVDAQAPAIVAALLAIGAGVWRRPFLLLLGGGALAIFGGFNDVGVLTQAVVHFPGPGWVARGAVLVALGAGAGTAVTGVLRLRATQPARITSDA